MAARNALLAPRISRSHLFLAVFFRVTYNGQSERGTTCSVVYCVFIIDQLSMQCPKNRLVWIGWVNGNWLWTMSTEPVSHRLGTEISATVFISSDYYSLRSTIYWLPSAMFSAQIIIIWKASHKSTFGGLSPPRLKYCHVTHYSVIH